MMFLPDRGFDIDFTIEGTTGIIVTTVDGSLRQFCCRIRDQVSILTLCQIVHIGLIYITRLIGITTVCPTKDATNLDGGTFWYINNGAASDTLVATSTIGCTNLSAYKINDGGGSDPIGIGSRYFGIECGHDFNLFIVDRSGRCHLITHTQSAVVASATHLHKT